MKTHSEFLPQLAAYHDGALSADQRESVASHVRDCPVCQRLLSDWQALDGAVKALPEITAETDGIRAQVLSRITPSAQPVRTIRSGRITRVPIRVWATAAAAVVILVGASWYVRDRSDTSDNLSFSTRDISPAPDAEAPIVPNQNGTYQSTPSSPDEKSPAEAIESVPRVDYGKLSSVAPEPVTPELSSNALADRSSSAAASDQSTAGDSGILQSEESSARLAELVAFEGPEGIEVHYRVPDLLDPAIVDVNLRPTFAVEFEGIGYAPTDMLAEAYDPSLSEPRRLSPQVAYMVSSMRMERSVLMSRTANQVRSPETQLRLAEITWRLANMTADQDDVRNAIAAQTAAMRAVPSLTTQSLARLAHLRSLQQ